MNGLNHITLKNPKGNMNEGPIIVATAFYILSSFINGLISFITAIKLSRGDSIDPALPSLSFLLTPVSWFFLCLLFIVINDMISKFHREYLLNHK
jgi:hypothetical protein